jgi:hypothetical protein
MSTDPTPAVSSGARCALHPDRDALRTCARCGAFMCGECGASADGRCGACAGRDGVFLLSRQGYDFGRVWDVAFEAFKRQWVMLSVAALFVVLGAVPGSIISSIVQAVGGAVSGSSPYQPGQPIDARVVTSVAIAVGAQGIGTLVNVVVQGLVLMGVLRVAFDVLHGGTVSLERLLSQLRRLPDYIVAQFAIFMAFSIPMAVALLLPIALVVVAAGGTSFEALRQLELEQLFGVGSVVALMAWWGLVGVAGTLAYLPLTLCTAEIVYGGASGVESLRRAWALGTGHRGTIFLAHLVGGLIALGGMLVCCVGVIPALGLMQMIQATLYLALRKGSELPPPVEP